MNHPNRETLTLLAYGFLSPSEETAARAHLAECPACRAEWTASRGEAAAVKSAFEPAGPARSRVVAWWPAVAGFAAAVLLGFAFTATDLSDRAGNSMKKPAPAMSRMAEQAPAGIVVTAEWAGAKLRRNAASEIALDEGRVIVTNWSVPLGVVATSEATVSLKPGSTSLVDVSNGETRVVCQEGAGTVRANGVEVELKAGDSAGVPVGRGPLVVRAVEDPAPRIAALRGRLASLEARMASLPPNPDRDSETPEGVGRWLARAVIAGRKLEDDVAMGEELGRLWSRLLRAEGVSSREIEAGPARERLLAGYLEVRCPMDDAKVAAWAMLINEHETAWVAYLRTRKSLSGFERALAAAKVAEKREPRYAALLGYGQVAAVAELDAAFREWRRGFVPVFNIVVGIGGPEKALEAAAGPGGMPARVVPIMREHLDACLALHREFKGSGDPAGEQVRLIELFIKTRDRLVVEAGIPQDSASSRVVNFVEGASK